MNNLIRWSLIFLLLVQLILIPINRSFGEHSISFHSPSDSISFTHPLDSIEPKMRIAYNNGFDAYIQGDYSKADSLWTISLNLRSIPRC